MMETTGEAEKDEMQEAPPPQHDAQQDQPAQQQGSSATVCEEMDIQDDGEGEAKDGQAQDKDDAPAESTKRSWEGWTSAEFNLFLEGIVQHGRNFDAVKSKFLKTKSRDQIRHYYYRLVKKLRTMLSPAIELEQNNHDKEIQAVTCYWEVRKKLSQLSQKTSGKQREDDKGIPKPDEKLHKAFGKVLQELMTAGTVTCRKGKRTVTIKMPTVSALALKGEKKGGKQQQQQGLPEKDAKRPAAALPGPAGQQQGAAPGAVPQQALPQDTGEARSPKRKHADDIPIHIPTPTNDEGRLLWHGLFARADVVRFAAEEDELFVCRVLDTFTTNRPAPRIMERIAFLAKRYADLGAPAGAAGSAAAAAATSAPATAASGSSTSSSNTHATSAAAASAQGSLFCGPASLLPTVSDESVIRKKRKVRLPSDEDDTHAPGAHALDGVSGEMAEGGGDSGGNGGSEPHRAGGESYEFHVPRVPLRKARSIPLLTPGQNITCFLFPRNESVEETLQQQHVSSQLKLSLRCDKKIPAILAFLRKRWESSEGGRVRRIPGIEHMRLFPTQDYQRMPEFDAGWGWDHVDVTVAKIYSRLGCPERFELEYGWPLPSPAAGVGASGLAAPTAMQTAAPSTASLPATMLAFAPTGPVHGSYGTAAGVLFGHGASGSYMGAHTLPSLEDGVHIDSDHSEGDVPDSLFPVVGAWGSMVLPPSHGFPSVLDGTSDFPPLDEPRKGILAAATAASASSSSGNTSPSGNTSARLSPPSNLDGIAVGGVISNAHDMAALMSFPAVSAASSLFAAAAAGQPFFMSSEGVQVSPPRASFTQALPFSGSGAASTSQHILAMDSLSSADFFEGFMASQTMSSLPNLSGFPLK